MEPPALSLVRIERRTEPPALEPALAFEGRTRSPLQEQATRARVQPVRDRRGCAERLDHRGRHGVDREGRRHVGREGAPAVRTSAGAPSAALSTPSEGASATARDARSYDPGRRDAA